MSLQEGIFVLGSFVLTVLVSLGAYRSNRLLRDLGTLPFNPLLAPAENGLKLVLLALLAVLGSLSGIPAHRFGLVPLKSDDIILGLAVGLAAWMVTNAVTVLAVAHWGRKIISSLVIRALIPHNRQEWLATVLAMGLSVLLEEVLFRSILLGGFSTWIPLLIVLPLSGALFGLLHSIQGRLGIIVATALGVALGLLFLWRSSLWPPLIAHYIINMGQITVAARRPDLLEK